MHRPAPLRLVWLCALWLWLWAVSASASPTRLPSSTLIGRSLVWTEEDGGSYSHHRRHATHSTTLSLPPSIDLTTPGSSPHSFHVLQGGGSSDPQYLALLDLYNGTSGPQWLNSTGWATSLPYCAWYGVTCSAAGSVTSLQLVNNGLSGPLPSSLASLLALSLLDLSLNPAVIGSLPPSYSALSSSLLYLNLRGAGLSGPVPPVICSWRSLQNLDISDNHLSGSLPPCLSQLSSLQQISLGENSLQGTIPSTYSTLTQLYLFDVAHNGLTGDLKPVTGLPQLGAIFAHHNAFTGPLPLDLLSTSKLIMLDLSYNSFTSISCGAYESGAVRNQSGLVDLILSSNALSDSVNDAINCLAAVAPSASWIDLSNNSLTWDGSRSLKFASSEFPYIYKLDLSSNRLQGSVGYFLQSFFWLGQLYYFSFQQNQLTGTATDIAGQFLELNAAGNPIQAALHNSTSPNSPVIVPNWISLQNSTQLSQLGRNMTCPLIGPSSASNLIQLTVDPAYLAYQHCQCDSDYAVSIDSDFTQPDTVTCLPCPERVSCSRAVFSPQHAPTPGYYPFPLNPVVYNNNSRLLVTARMVACNPLSICSTSAADGQSDAGFSCATGHDIDSFLCSRCAYGYFNWNGYCNVCSDSSALWLLPFFLIIVGLLAFAGAVWYFEREERAKYNRYLKLHPHIAGAAANPSTPSSHNHHPQSIDISPPPPPTLPPDAPTHPQDDPYVGHLSVLPLSPQSFDHLSSPTKPPPPLPLRPGAPAPPSVPSRPLTLLTISPMVVDSKRWALVDIIIFWWQTSSVLQGLNYQDSTAGNSSASSMASLSVVGYLLRFSPFAFECMFGGGVDFRAYFWVILFSPLWLSGATLVTYQLLVLVHRWMARKGWADYFMLDWIFARACIRLLALLLSLVYMQVAIFAFSVWICDSVSSQGTSYHYLHQAPYVECFTGPHVAQIVFSVLIFGIFVLGLPIATVHWMNTLGNSVRTIEEDVMAARPYRTIRQLFTEDAKNKLRQGMSWWAGLVVFRKLLLTAIVYLIPSTSSAIPVLVLLILFLLVAMQAWYTPYFRWVDNVLESGLLVHLALEFLVSILIGEAALTGDGTSYNQLQSFLSALNWIGYAVVGLALLLHVALYFIKDDAMRVQDWTERISVACCWCLPPTPLAWRSRVWDAVNLLNYMQGGSDSFLKGSKAHRDSKVVAAASASTGGKTTTAAALSRGSSAASYAAVPLASPGSASFAYPLASPQYGGRLTSEPNDGHSNGRSAALELSSPLRYPHHSVDLHKLDSVKEHHHRLPPAPPQ